MILQKVKMQGSLSIYDAEMNSSILNDEWECFYINQRVEYWENLFKSYGNNHPFRSTFAGKVNLVKRQKQCKDFLLKNSGKCN